MSFNIGFNMVDEELVQIGKVMFGRQRLNKSETNKCSYIFGLDPTFGEIPVSYTEKESGRSRLVYVSVNQIGKDIYV